MLCCVDSFRGLLLYILGLGGGGGGHVSQVVEQQVWCSDGAGSIPQFAGIFLPELTFNADSLMVFEHPCVKQGFFSQN